MGVSYAGLLITNGLAHFGAFAHSGIYNPGLVTATILFFPLFFWVVYVCFGRGRMSYWILTSIVLAGLILSFVLLGSMHMRVQGAIGNTTLICIRW